MVFFHKPPKRTFANRIVRPWDMRKLFGNNINSRIEISKLADMACMSKDHFTRMFRRETGETPNQYIILRKMEKAELLIVTTDMSVKSVANALGYDDSSYFNRLFRKQTGVTPQQYRESQI